MNTLLPIDKNRRLLIIDDNRAIHADFRKILCPDPIGEAELESMAAEIFGPAASPSLARFEVGSAYQGREGVDMVQLARTEGRPYAMAFVDMRMPPGIDGVETIQQIWAIDSEIQIVLCTAYSDSLWDEVLEKTGNNDRMLILKKPFEAVEAFQMAQALAGKWSLARRAGRKMAELEEMVAARTREWKEINIALQLQARVIETERSRLVAAQAVAKIGSWETDSATHAVIWSLETHRIFETDPATFRPTHEQFLEFVHPEDRLAVDSAFLRSLESFTPCVIDHRVLMPDGRIKFVEDRWQAYPAEEGNPTRAIGTCQDITERKQLEAQLFQARKMETVGKLAGGLAHEFNSILTSIIGQSELLHHGLPIGSALAAAAIEISKGAARAAVLIRQLLAFGRKQILQPAILDLNTLVDGLWPLLPHLAGSRVEMRFEPTPGLPPVRADPGQIEQVILNLFLNAAKAMPDGGTITVATARSTLEPKSPSRLPDCPAGEYVTLTVADTGIGMTKEAKSHIFEPFFSTGNVGEGAGLGLASCHGIIRQSGGQITVSSELGRGSAFKIFLPVADSAPCSLAPPSHAEAYPQGSETILLVEADPALRVMASNLLRTLGYTVLPAENAADAATLARHQIPGQIDLLLINLDIPDQNALELADRIQVLFPRMKTLFGSASRAGGFSPNRLPGREREAFQKPFTPSSLAQQVARILRQ